MRGQPANQPTETGRFTADLSAGLKAYAALVSRGRTRRVFDTVARDRQLVVAHTRLEAQDVMVLELVDPDGTELPPWSPGAHVDLTLPSGRVRQYSLCGDPDDRTVYRIAVRRLDSGAGGSREVHELISGMGLTVRAPRNAFTFAYPHLSGAPVDDVAFIAGGIGITALLPMVLEAVRSRTRWTLTYLNRDIARTAFADEVSRLDGRNVRLLYGRREVGQLLDSVSERTAVYFCGPASLLSDVQQELRTRPHAGLHFERFTPAPVADGTPFTVKLQRTGVRVHVPADRSTLSAVRDVLPALPYSCQQGFCGTCRVGLVDGEVQRRGGATFGYAPDTILPCVDRSAGTELTVDL